MKRPNLEKIERLFEENEDFIYKRGGDIVILYVPQTYEEKIIYLVNIKLILYFLLTFPYLQLISY